VVVLKLKYADFRLVTRRMTLTTATDDGLEIHRSASALLAHTPLEARVRLHGRVGARSRGRRFAAVAVRSGCEQDEAIETWRSIASPSVSARAPCCRPMSPRSERALDDSWDDARRKMGASRVDPQPVNPLPETVIALRLLRIRTIKPSRLPILL